MKKNLATYESETIKDSNGNVTTASNTKSFKAEAEPPYVKLYLQDIAYLNGITGTGNDIIGQLLKYIDYNNEITIIKRQKEEIAKELNCAIGTINNLMSELVKKEILLKVDRSCFIFNPFLFGKGRWKDIMKMRKDLKFESFYSAAEGRKIVPKSTQDVIDNIIKKNKKVS